MSSTDFGHRSPTIIPPGMDELDIVSMPPQMLVSEPPEKLVLRGGRPPVKTYTPPRPGDTASPDHPVLSATPVGEVVRAVPSPESIPEDTIGGDQVLPFLAALGGFLVVLSVGSGILYLARVNGFL